MLFGLVASLLVPAAARADHFGSNWLSTGQLEGTMDFKWSDGYFVDDDFARHVSYTLNFPSGEITDLDFSWTDQTSSSWEDTEGGLHTCVTSHTEYETGPGEAAYWTPNAQAHVDQTTGHTYGFLIDPVKFPVHWSTTYSDCPFGFNNEEGDYIWDDNPTAVANCSTDSNDPWSCSTDDRTQLVAEHHLTIPQGDWSEKYDVSWDLTWTPPEECAPAGTPTTSDSDGDRLPNAYETKVLFTDPGMTDTDQDCYGDALEIASGSSPTTFNQTPDTLSRGSDPLLVQGTGDTGVTCGVTKFKWYTPSLKSLGVAAGTKGCIYLYSNTIANKVADYAIEFGPDITTTLEKMTTPYLSDIYGSEIVDWVKDKKVDAAIWGAERYLKMGMRAGLNLSRLNAIYTAGKIAGLNAIALGGVWKLNQIRNNSACIQVRIGTSSTGTPKMSWSLVYSADQVTDPKLSFAGTWKKKEGGIDQAVRAPINLQCNDGQVVANGLSAAKVFDNAVSELF